MLFNPPSMICRLLTPLLALRTPCVSSAMSARYWLATASPAASSPEELMRKPGVRRWIVWLSKLWLILRFSWAINDATFVWIEIDIDEFLLRYIPTASGLGSPLIFSDAQDTAFKTLIAS